MQPRIDVEGAAEGVEAVVGEDDEERVGIGGFEGLCEQRVVAFVFVFDLAFVVASEIGIVQRMRFIAEAPEHVLHAVGSIEDDEEEAFAEAGEFVEHHAFAFSEDEITLLEVRGFVNAAVIERSVVFGHAERGIEAECFGEFLGHFVRPRNGEHGRGRVVVRRRNVEFDVRFELAEIDADHAGDRLQHGELEFDAEPRAPIAERDFDFFGRAIGVEDDFFLGAAGFDADLVSDVGGGIGAGLARADEVSGEGIAGGQVDDLLAFFHLDGAVLRVEGAGALAAAQIGNADAAEDASVRDFVGREGARAAHHAAWDAGGGESLPEGNAAALIDNARRGKHVLAGRETIERVFGVIRFGIARDEIENAVGAGICAGGEGRPRDWSLRRVGGFEASVGATGFDSGEIGEFTAGEHCFDDRRLEAIEADDNDFLFLRHQDCLGGSLPAAASGAGSIGLERPKILRKRLTTLPQKIMRKPMIVASRDIAGTT